MDPNWPDLKDGFLFPAVWIVVIHSFIFLPLSASSAFFSLPCAPSPILSLTCHPPALVGFLTFISDSFNLRPRHSFSGSPSATDVSLGMTSQPKEGTFRSQRCLVCLPHSVHMIGACLSVEQQGLGDGDRAGRVFSY